MKIQTLLVLTLTLIAAIGTNYRVAAQSLVLTNGVIYTVDQDRSRAEALAIDENGMLIAVGTEAEAMAAAGPNTRVIDLDGRMVLPGFQDVHLHAVEAGINATLCLFEAFDTLHGYREAVEDCARNGETGEWVLGAGVNMFNLLELHDNPVEILDELSPDRPVLILDDIGHGAWANSHALALAGYDKAPDADDGNIILRAQDGTPNGVVLENAPHNLRTAAFSPTVENLELAYGSLLDAAAELNANGITTVSDAGGYWPQGHHKAWERAEREGTLTVRASNALYFYPDLPIGPQIERLKTLHSDDPDRLVRFNQVKIYVDGILSLATSALLDPYEAELELEPQDRSGFLYFSPAKLKGAAEELTQAGFQLHFHVTGDRGARLALDAIAGASSEPGPHRLTHLYLVDPQDYSRFEELGVVADLQLAPSSLDPEYEHHIASFIGARAKTLMPAGDLINAGALVTLSSDWDADELNPLVKMQAAIKRKRNGIPDLATAIELMTINPAKLLRHSDRTGSIEVGKVADLVVLSDDILSLPLDDIAEVRVEATLLQGEPVFDDGGVFE